MRVMGLEFLESDTYGKHHRKLPEDYPHRVKIPSHDYREVLQEEKS